jgi:hypothetical protein
MCSTFGILYFVTFGGRPAAGAQKENGKARETAASS